MRVMRTAVILAAAALGMWGFTGCGSSNSISSLTDSDTVTSSEAADAAEVDSSIQTVPAQMISSLPTLASNSDPSILPQVKTETAPVPAEEPNEVGEAGPEEEEFIPAGEGNTGRTTTEVKFRLEPDTGSDDNVIDELDEGTEVVVLEVVDGGWYRVLVGDTEGYIKADYVK